MDTLITKPQGEPTPRQALRLMSEEAWRETHGSGTLRKNSRLQMRSRQQYLQERIAWEFGHAFEILYSSRVTYGEARTEGDSHPVTEAGWFIDRYFTINGTCFPQDRYECKYISVTDPSGSGLREGIGIMVRETATPWLPESHCLFAIVAEYDPKTHDFKKAVNPL